MRFDNAAVCSPLTLASETGVAILRAGGNAVDAAIATNLVLAVAYPHMCGVGGDLMAMVWHDDELVGLNSSGALPAAARLPAGGVPELGIGSATVPGAPAGWRALADRFGTASLRELAEPAVRLARDGIERSPGLTRYTAESTDLLARDADAQRIFLARGRLVQEELAETLEALYSFYEGKVAARAPKPFSPDDFERHEAKWVRPVRETFAGLDVFELPPNSRGHLALAALRLLEPLDGLSPEDPEWHARLVRAFDAVLPGGDTVYLCVVDGNRMCVSMNQSLFMAFGSGVVIPGTGVLLHNRGAYHSEETYRGGAAPIHTLAPAMALRNERPFLVFGTMGGEAQIQIHLQLLARIEVAGQPVEDAVAAPRWVLQRDALLVEPGLPPLHDVLPHLNIRTIESGDAAGHAHAIKLEEHALFAAADPRADGVPLGF